jgi:hypothetical protein
VLYEEQNFGDSFVDESFLESLIVNANLRERNYWQVVCDTTFLTQQLATVAASVSVSYLLYQASLLSTFQCRCSGQPRFSMYSRWIFWCLLQACQKQVRPFTLQEAGQKQVNPFKLIMYLEQNG